MMKNRLRLLAIAGTVFFTALAPAIAETETVERTMELAPDGQVNLKNINGDLVIHTWNKDQVKVTATKRTRGSGADARERLAEWEIRFEASYDQVDIATIKPSGKRGWSFWNNHGVSIHYELWVPEAATLGLRTTNGDISVEDVGGRVTANSTNGDIEIGRVGGPVKAGVTNGDIRINEADGTIQASTTNGSIHARLLSHNGEDMDFHTTNGRINVALPSDIRVEVKANTTNGSIKSDLPVSISGAVSKRKLYGKINGGGPLLRLQTTNGSITLEEY